MKNKTIYLLLLFLSSVCISAQVRQFQLNKGGCQLYNGYLYNYGMLSLKPNAVFCIYKLDLQLNTIDSAIIELGITKPENYLQLYSDTLHDCLNIYLQKKEKKNVNVLRFNAKMEILANMNDVDIARLNNTATFSEEVLYLKNSVFTLKTVTDTSGKQFYLNKYELKSKLENFDYTLKWQFPFERKNVDAAHIFYANNSIVFLYVNIIHGLKAGQWLLKIDAQKGSLIKGTKLNDKGEAYSYQFGNFHYDKLYKSLHLLGQKYSENQFDPKENKLAISNLAFASIYILELDSLGEIGSKQEFKIPINDLKTGAKSLTNSYILRFNKFQKTIEGKLFFEADVYKGPGKAMCYLYSNSTAFYLNSVEGLFVLEKNTITPNLSIENYYTVYDKLDMNGKLCIDSLNQFGKFFYKPITFPVKQQFKLNSEGNAMWILTKHTAKKNTVNYSFLIPLKKIYQISPIEEIIESSNPVFINLNSSSFLISWQIEEYKYQLKLYTW